MYPLVEKHWFTFMHLADAFIQSDLQCIQAIHLLSVCVFPGNRTHNLVALLTRCSTTEPQEHFSWFIEFKSLCVFLSPQVWWPCCLILRGADTDKASRSTWVLHFPRSRMGGEIGSWVWTSVAYELPTAHCPRAPTFTFNWRHKKPWIQKKPPSNHYRCLL